MVGKHKDLFTSISPSQVSDSSTVVQHSPLHSNVDGLCPVDGADRENDVEIIRTFLQVNLLHRLVIAAYWYNNRHFISILMVCVLSMVPIEKMIGKQ